MKWISVLDRKPKESGFYYWRGKGHHGGQAWYDPIRKEFDFPENIPVNKIDENCLYWLDESNDNCINCGKPKEDHSTASELCPTRFSHFEKNER